MTKPFDPSKDVPPIEQVLAPIIPMLDQRVFAQAMIRTYQRCLRDPDFFHAWLEANIDGPLTTDIIAAEHAKMPARIQALKWGLEATEWGS